MTDKELRRLKRMDLLEILFYLQKELEEVKQENQTLKQRIDELTKTSFNSEVSVSSESISGITEAVKQIVKECLEQNNFQPKAKQ